MIELRDLHKRFGAVAALQGATFTVPDARIVALLGPNGAGKTTALRIVAGVLAADRGAVRVDGLDVVADRAAAQRRLGVLSHAHGLYPRLTAREQIAYFGRLRGLAGDDLAVRVEHAIRALGVEDFADRRAEGFSQGQKVRVALARALVHSPRNLVLDEPTAGLDVAATRALRATLRALRDEGRCVLLSTHVMQEVETLCDEVVVISAGRVVATGTPEGLLQLTGRDDLEDAFVDLIGTAEGLG